MPIDRVRLEKFTEEDAFAFSVECLRQSLDRTVQIAPEARPFDVSINAVSKLWCIKEQITENNDLINAHPLISGKFYSAFWALCLRGVLRPSVTSLGVTSTQINVPGNDYSLTEKGRLWLRDSSQDAVLISNSSLLQLFSQNSGRFGSGFMERATEAVNCFERGCYLSCCVMCGAAAEAVFLALAITKVDEATVLEKYKASSGRKYVKDLLERGQPSGLVQEISSGFSLLSHWRDNAAHGAASQITMINARTSLNILLGLVQVANARWTDLTVRAAAPVAQSDCCP